MAGEFNVPGVVKVGGQASLAMGQTDHTSDETSRPARPTTTTTTTTIMPAQYFEACLHFQGLRAGVGVYEQGVGCR